MGDILIGYEERFYESIDQVSVCPYCGLDRIIIHSHDPAYEESDEYRVEHVDEKEAATRGCFTMYYAFGSKEDALRKANTRNGTLVDKWGDPIEDSKKGR